MKKSAKLLTFLSFMALTAVLAGCGADDPNTSDASLTLRTYTVPQGDAEALSSALNHVLGLDDSKHDIGRTYWSGPGQVLVLAPAHLQASIANSIQQMVGQSHVAANAQPLRLNVWIVDVYRGSGALDPSLKTIEPALQSFAEDSGAAHFAQKRYFSAVSDPCAETMMSPIPFYLLHYSITGNGDRLVLKFDYHHRPAGQPPELLSGQVTTRLGQTLVLGLLGGSETGGAESSKTARAADGARNAEPSYKLLVVRIVPATQG